MKKTVTGMTLIMLPFIVSGALVLFNGFDLEFLGFWGVLQSGPFAGRVMMMDGPGVLLMIPLISNLGMAGLAFWLKDKSWKANIGLYLGVLGWYGIAVGLFLSNLVIA